VGGHCIPVDPWYLVEAFPEHTGLLRQARQISDGQAERLLTLMLKIGPLRAGDKFAVLGAAYKADIDDMRESPARLLVQCARQHGLEVMVHDPLVRPGASHGLEVSRDLPSCLRGAAAAVLTVEHKAYRGLSARFFAEHMTGRLIGDARNWLNHASLRRGGFRVVLLGNGAQGNGEKAT
jgi:UDP-N-acetyl-D-mannosaminuronate dehydrogenase